MVIVHSVWVYMPPYIDRQLTVGSKNDTNTLS